MVVPQILISIAIGYLGLNFLPIYSLIVKENNLEKQSKFVFTTIFYVIVFATTVILLSLFFVKYLFNLLLSGWDESKLNLVIKIYFVLCPSFIFISVNTILTFISQFHNRFIKPKIVPTFLGILPAMTLLLFYEKIGIFSLAVGFVLLNIIQFLYLSTEFFGVYQIQLDPKNKNALKVIKSSIFISLTGIFSKIYPAIEKYFASYLISGSI